MSAGAGPSGPTPEHSDTSPGEHLGELVVDLVDGRLGDADPGLVLQHLDSCPDCRTGLADAVVAAAALRGVVASPRPVPADAAAPLPPLSPPPPLSSPPPEALDRPRTRPRADLPEADHPRARRGRRAPALAGALAVVLLAVGVLGGVGWSHRPGPVATAGPAADSAAAAPLTALFRTGDRTRGAAVITGSGSTRRMTIQADTGTPASGTLVTVWLTAPGEPSQHIGTLDGSGHGSFVMSATTAAEYSAVVLTEQPGPVTRLDRAAVIATAALT